jgi:hypothetical protein
MATDIEIAKSAAMGDKLIQLVAEATSLAQRASVVANTLVGCRATQAADVAAAKKDASNLTAHDDLVAPLAEFLAAAKKFTG